MPSQSVQQSHLCLVFSTVTARLCSCHAHLATSSSWGICSTVGFLFSKGIVLVSHRFFLLQRQRKKKAFMTGPLNAKAGACFRQVKKKKNTTLSALTSSCRRRGFHAKWREIQSTQSPAVTDAHAKMKSHLSSTGKSSEVLQPTKHFWSFRAKQCRVISLNNWNKHIMAPDGWVDTDWIFYFWVNLSFKGIVWHFWAYFLPCWAGLMYTGHVQGWCKQEIDCILWVL